MYGVVEEDWPLTSVKKLFYCRFTKHQVNFSYKRIAMLVLLLAEVVEGKIARLLKNQVACALSDGWTRDSIHYVCLHASFIHDEGGPEEEHMVLLLGVSPVISAEVEDDADIQEEIRVEAEDMEPHYSHNFDVATMLTHFEDISLVDN